MTPQALKSAILQLAIQGKLVPQRPEDGVARVPAALNTEKRKARRHGEEIEPPFEIPENWRWVRLGQLFDIARGGSPRPIKAFLTTEENGLNWIKIGDTNKNSKYINSCREKIIPSGLSKTRQVFKGDLLLTNSMSFGRPYILNIDGCIHDGWLVLHPASSDLFKDFFFYLLSSPVVFKQFQTAAAGAVVQNLNSDKVSQTLVPLPPIPEQHRIVAKIEELLPLVDRYEQAWTKLEDFTRRFPADMQKSLLQLAIQGQLVEQCPEEGTGEDLYREILATKNTKKSKKEKPLPEIAEDEIPFEIPESWKWIKLGNVASVLGGKRIPAGRKLTADNTGHIYIRVSDMKNGSVMLDHLLYVPTDIYPGIARYVIHKEDVYVTVAGTIGRVGKIPEEIDGANLTENADRLVFQLINQDWLIKCLGSSLIQEQIADATTKVGQPKLAIKRIQELVLPLPPLAEQKRIVAKLEELLPLCERLILTY